MFDMIESAIATRTASEPLPSSSAPTLGRPAVMRGANAGDVFTIESPGGGGYGDPAKRPDDLIRRDLEEGYVTQWPETS